jgi:hypothetical protein
MGLGLASSWFFQNASSPAHTPKNTVKKARQMTPRMHLEYAGGFGFGGVGGGVGGVGGGLLYDISLDELYVVSTVTRKAKNGLSWAQVHCRLFQVVVRSSLVKNRSKKATSAEEAESEGT